MNWIAQYRVAHKSINHQNVKCKALVELRSKTGHILPTSPTSSDFPVHDVHIYKTDNRRNWWLITEIWRRRKTESFSYEIARDHSINHRQFSKCSMPAANDNHKCYIGWPMKDVSRFKLPQLGKRIFRLQSWHFYQSSVNLLKSH